MRYLDKEQCQLECDLLNKRTHERQYSPAAIQAVPHREFAKREMWTPWHDRELTRKSMAANAQRVRLAADVVTRRTMYHA